MSYDGKHLGADAPREPLTPLEEKGILLAERATGASPGSLSNAAAEARVLTQKHHGAKMPVNAVPEAPRGFRSQTVKQVVRVRIGQSFDARVLDFGAAGGVVIAGVLSRTEMDSLIAGRIPSAWAKPMESKKAARVEAAPKPRIPSIRDAVTKGQVREMLDEAEANGQPLGDAPDFLPGYETVHEEAAAQGEEVTPKDARKPHTLLEGHIGEGGRQA
jgi:hypothetical protein